MTRMVEAVVELVDRPGAPRGVELVSEALLWRGFLVERRGSALIIERGSAGGGASDVDTLAPLLDVVAMPGGETEFRLGTRDSVATARAILRLGGGTGFTGTSPVPTSWTAFREQVWGHQVPVCPDSGPALDIGVALFVKALPVVACATQFSCDGHGDDRPAWIDFLRTWDRAWARAVLEWLGIEPLGSSWDWTVAHDGARLEVHPRLGYGMDGLQSMFADIQSAARACLRQGVRQRVFRAREGAVASFGESLPSEADFLAAARRQLAIV